MENQFTSQPTPTKPPEELKKSLPQKPTPYRWHNLLVYWETIKAILIVAALALVFRLVIFQPFIVDGSSMEPTYHNGDYLLVDKVSYWFRTPKRGEVIVFRYPRNPKEAYIKRVIGLPGETVKIADGKVQIFSQGSSSGSPLHEGYLPDSISTETLNINQEETYQLQVDEFYVLGDNRAGSSDSRVFGPVKKDLIIGRSLIRLFPINQIKVFAKERQLYFDTPTAASPAI